MIEITLCIKKTEIQPVLSRIEVEPRKEKCACEICREFYNVELGSFYRRCLEMEIPIYSLCKKDIKQADTEVKTFSYTLFVIIISVIGFCVVSGAIIYKKHKIGEIFNNVSFLIHFIYLFKSFFINKNTNSSNNNTTVFYALEPFFS